MRSTFQSGVLGGSLSAAGLFLLASVIGGAFPAIQQSFLIRLFAVPGEFLFSAFSYMALFAPLYLMGNGILILTGRDNRVSLYASSWALIPVLSLAVMLRLMIDPGFVLTPVGSAAVAAFSSAGAIAISATLSAIGLLLITRYILLTIAPAAEGSGEDSPLESDEVEEIEDLEALDLPQILLPERTVPAERHIPGSGVEAFVRTNMSEFTASQHDDDFEDLSADAEPIEGPVREGLSGNQPAETFSADWRAESDTEVNMGFADHGTNRNPVFDDEIEAIEEEIIHLDFSKAQTDSISARAGFSPAKAGVDLDIDDFLPADREYAEDPAEYIDDDLSEDELAEDDDELPVNEDLLPHAEPSGELNFSRKSGPYEIPMDGVLQKQSHEAYWIIDQETTDQSEILRHTLQQFSIEAEVTGIRKGPVITMFEILPAPGVKLTRIVNLADNIALALAAASVRIVAPIPGKHAVGIEVPNKRRHLVTFSEILNDDEFREGDHGIPVALGKDITGEAQIVDLTKTPHVLIAGATGAGKSVCVNSIITSILYARDPDEVNMILIDPKIVELKFYNDIPHLLTPVVTDPKKAFQALQWCLFEMERRYSLLDAMAVRDIKSYNRKIVEKKIATVKLPYIVVVVDEFADLMATSGKELESTLARLAAMSRAVGIHLVLATQRPSTDVITGLIKANIPSRIAFMVASKVDSRIIIDAVGAEKLLGKGDMLFTSSWDPFPKRIQGAFLSEAEVEEVVKHVKEMGSPDYIDDEIFIEEDESSINAGELDDPLMQKAIDIVISANKASASYLQRRLSIGYNRAARLIEEMEEMGIVGPANGSKPREILRTREVL
jgi:S-DNA-T family DNA segregation ATPase FtsK/SpoIIIE